MEERRIERKRHALQQEGDKKKRSSVRKIGTYTVYSERLCWHKWSPDGQRSYCTHIYRRKKDMHPSSSSSSSSRLSPPLTQREALHLQQGFPLGYTPLQAVFLTLLSLFFIRSWPASFFFLHTPLNSKSSWNKCNKYQISYIRSLGAACNCQR